MMLEILEDATLEMVFDDQGVDVDEDGLDRLQVLATEEDDDDADGSPVEAPLIGCEKGQQAMEGSPVDVASTPAAEMVGPTELEGAADGTFQGPSTEQSTSSPSSSASESSMGITVHAIPLF